jgi:hypothetical protein
MPTLTLNFVINRKLPDIVRDTFGHAITEMNVEQLRSEGFHCSTLTAEGSNTLTAKKKGEASFLCHKLELPILHDVELWSGSILFSDARLPDDLWELRGKSYQVGQAYLSFSFRQENREMEIEFRVATTHGLDLDGWRETFGSAIHRAERVIRLTTTTRRLLQATRGENKGYESRILAEHFKSITGILFP